MNDDVEFDITTMDALGALVTLFLVLLSVFLYLVFK